MKCPGTRIIFVYALSSQMSGANTISSRDAATVNKMLGHTIIASSTVSVHLSSQLPTHRRFMYMVESKNKNKIPHRQHIRYDQKPKVRTEDINWKHKHAKIMENIINMELFFGSISIHHCIYEATQA